MNLKYFLRIVFGTTFLLTTYFNSGAQGVDPVTQTNGSTINNIVTGVPFLLITPDSRAAGMGEAGVAIEGDVNAASINPAKLAFLEKRYGFSVSYSPWLKNIVDDVSLTYLSGFYKLDDQSTVGASLRYFSLGKIQLIDANQTDQGTYSPNEFAVDATYSRRFGETFSLGTSIRYVRSGLTSGQFNGQDTKAATALAADVSALLKKPVYLIGKEALLSAGINISNIGSKLSYSDDGTRYFLPTNLKIGAASTFLLDKSNELTFALDFNKLMVPTQPSYDVDGNIIAGKNPNRSVPAGIFGSFNDAPGGFKEEVKEVNVAFGMEYWYKKQIAFRTGYFYESPDKGDRRYFTLGAGFKYSNYNLDISYLIANQQRSPLANTLRFTLLFNFDSK
ncbi:type IX secretion system outer membrane channel protein PorV [Pedobacter sp. MC2016-14]|uniref:type IX secretion system outer membrane channel protein PorV n=1 Tax=Pedobacter sp. MC2016-14 TaxID=2897327 RepID=UPI001E3A2438|nr:type IX secretion system outer membrane channel protein PorV [Pedobacter sp. MC2016-14]MCD0487531.1 type IX secretion system outer membrane channel protein PorV [Pedobacter sp. MC2016-14]